MLLLRLLPVLPLLFGLFAGLIALLSWTAGDPPTWTIFSPQQTVTVVSSKMQRVPVGNGTLRDEAVIWVRWPPGRAGSTRLRGIRDSMFDSRERVRKAVEAHRPGTAARVRVYRDKPYAAETDWFALLHASALTLLSMLLVGFGAFLLFRKGGRGLQA